MRRFVDCQRENENEEDQDQLTDIKTQQIQGTAEEGSEQAIRVDYQVNTRDYYLSVTADGEPREVPN